VSGTEPGSLWTIACCFGGALLLMTAHGALLYAFTRQREHLAFTLLVCSLLCAHVVWAAHLLPPPVSSILPLSLARRVWPVSVAAVFACALLFRRAQRLDPLLPDWYELPSSRALRIGWAALAIGTLVTALCTLGYLPKNGLTIFAASLGATLHVLLAALSLVARLETLRENVSVAKEELSGKVSFLEDAVARATENTERAEQAARVKDEFMATMSHELRTPLNAIINLPPGLLRDFPIVQQLSCARCLALFELEEGDDPSEPRVCPDCPGALALAHKELVCYLGTPENTLRYLEKIERSGVHLLQVVNGILDAEQVKTGQLALTFGEADIAELTREVIEEMSDLAERGGVALALDNVPDGARTVVDRLRLRQVLINLISNAIKFSDRRGTVRVSVQAASDGFRFAVKDEGIGIASENLETVFGSFEQVHQADPRKFGGTGLGLFIARSLVRKHGGEMWVESTLGRGATFRFQIPRRERARSTANLRDSQVFAVARSQG
jgi:signal transduction histidine kinase